MGLSIVKNLSRRTAPKFDTHVRIDTLTLHFFAHPTPGSLGGNLLLKIFRDNFDLSTALFHVSMYRQCARKVGTRANSALIRYYLPRLKLSEGTNA